MESIIVRGGFKEVALLEVHKQPAPCPGPPLQHKEQVAFFLNKKKKTTFFPQR